MTVMIPRVHLNGTSKDELLGQLRAAHEALSGALSALRHGAPHGRDYYVISDEAWSEARCQHDDRVAMLEAVLSELEEIHQGVFVQ